MPLRAIARMIQTMLYAQRFFPYYVYNILGGIEDDGEQPFVSSVNGRTSEPLCALPGSACLPKHCLGIAGGHARVEFEYTVECSEIGCTISEVDHAQLA